MLETGISYLDRVRKHIKTPIALGFGISSRNQIDKTLSEVDIFVIGSKLMRVYDESQYNAIEAVKCFLKSFL